MTTATRTPCSVCMRRSECEHRKAPLTVPALWSVPDEPPDDPYGDDLRTPEQRREDRITDRVAAELERREIRRRADAVERPPSAPPATVSLRNFLAQPRNATKYRIDRLWPSGGKILLTAQKKSGKTTLIGNLIRCLVDGAPFLAKSYAPGDWRAKGAGFATSEPSGRPVVLLDFEMTHDMLAEWLGDQRIEHLDDVHVELMRGRPWDIRDDKVRAEWATYLRSIDAGTLIVDPIGPVLGMLGINEDKNSEVNQFLACLDRLAAEAGLDEHAIVQHAGHGEEQRARGASAFLGWPDATLQLIRGDEGARFLAAEGRDVDLPETALVFDRATRRLSLGEGNRVSTRNTGHKTVVAAIVDETAGLPTRKLAAFVADALGVGSAGSRDAIKAAVASRTIHVHYGPNRSQLHFSGAKCDKC